MQLAELYFIQFCTIFKFFPITFYQLNLSSFKKQMQTQNLWTVVYIVTKDF